MWQGGELQSPPLSPVEEGGEDIDSRPAKALLLGRPPLQRRDASQRRATTSSYLAPDREPVRGLAEKVGRAFTLRPVRADLRRAGLQPHHAVPGHAGQRSDTQKRGGVPQGQPIFTGGGSMIFVKPHHPLSPQASANATYDEAIMREPQLPQPELEARSRLLMQAAREAGLPASAPVFDARGPGGIELAILNPQPYYAVMTRDGQVGSDRKGGGEFWGRRRVRRRVSLS